MKCRNRKLEIRKKKKNNNNNNKIIIMTYKFIILYFPSALCKMFIYIQFNYITTKKTITVK